MQDVHVEIKPGFGWQKQVSTRRRSIFHQQIRLKSKNVISKVEISSVVFYGAESWTIRKVDQKYMEKISWTEHVTHTKGVTYSQGGEE
jgi:hypothetical protein